MATENKYNLDIPQIPAGEPVILFRAQDAATVALLEVYAILCRHLGSPNGHIDHVHAVRQNFQDWQNKNTDKVKAPD